MTALPQPGEITYHRRELSDGKTPDSPAKHVTTERVLKAVEAMTTCSHCRALAVKWRNTPIPTAGIVPPRCEPCVFCAEVL